MPTRRATPIAAPNTELRSTHRTRPRLTKPRLPVPLEMHVTAITPPANPLTAYGIRTVPEKITELATGAPMAKTMPETAPTAAFIEMDFRIR
jgi:hypothetical protein